jgi:hypothetical protein
VLQQSIHRAVIMLTMSQFDHKHEWQSSCSTKVGLPMQPASRLVVTQASGSLLINDELCVCLLQEIPWMFRESSESSLESWARTHQGASAANRWEALVRHVESIDQDKRCWSQQCTVGLLNG